MLSLTEYKEEYGLPTSMCLNVTDFCNYACRYCMPGDTKIFMSDGTIKNIKDIQVGDEIFSCQEKQDKRGGQKKIKKTKVINISTRTTNEIIQIKMQDGKEIQLTPNHPVLNGRGKWTKAKNLQPKTGMIMSLGYTPINSSTDIYEINYVKGYFIGMWLTDGMYEHYSYPSGEIYSIRLAVKDDEIISRMKQYCNILNFDYTTRDFLISKKESLKKEAIFSGKQKSFLFINNLEKDFRINFNNYLKNDNWIKGFLAAVYDAEGHIDKDNYSLSISNSDIDVLNMWEQGLSQFGFEIIRDGGDKRSNLAVYRSRLLSNKYNTLQKQLELFNLVQPAVKRKSFDILENSCCLIRNRIKEINYIKKELTVYNLETDQHTFIANGLAVHNCFINQTPNFMSLDTAITAIEYLMKNLKRKREIENNNSLTAILNFFGGEPMLLYEEIIVPITQYIKEKYPKDIKLGITTNGSLLSKERIDFLYNNNIIPLLSMDGDRATQEYNRPCKNNQSSFDLVEKNIPYLLEKFPNTTFRMTIYEDTCNQLFNNILYAEKMGFNNFVCVPDSRNNFSEETFIILQKELEKYALYLYGNAQDRIHIIEGEFFNSALIQTLDIIANNNFTTDIYLFGKDIVRCGLGTTSISVSPLGNILACQEQSSLCNKENIFFIGDIYNGIDKNKHLNLLKNYRGMSSVVCEDIEKCKNCKLQNKCVDIDCPSASYERFNNFYTQSLNTCRWKQILFDISETLLSQQNLQFSEYIDYILEKREKEVEHGQHKM